MHRTRQLVTFVPIQSPTLFVLFFLLLFLFSAVHSLSEKDRVYRWRGTVKHLLFYRLILLTAIGPADEKLFLLLSIEGTQPSEENEHRLSLSLSSSSSFCSVPCATQ